MALSAHDAEDRVEQLIILTERLTELVAGQALAFEQRRPQDAAALLEETSRLANLYRHESGRLKADPQLIMAADKASRLKLMKATFGVESLDGFAAFERAELAALRWKTSSAATSNPCSTRLTG